MKYLVINRDDIEVAILFPELIQHKEAAKALRHDDKIIAAGFCKIDEGRNVFTWGQSDGLKIKSRGVADAIVINFTITLPTLPPFDSAPSTLNPQPSTTLEAA